MAKYKKNKAALNPRSFPVRVRNLVDIDYADKLSPKDQEKLATFLDAYYNHKFREDTKLGGKGWTKEQRAQAYRFDNASRQDALTQSNQDMLEYTEIPTEAIHVAPLNRGAISPEDAMRLGEVTPEYLNSAEYKAALAAYREQLIEPKGRGARWAKHPVTADEIRALYKKQRELEMTIPHDVIRTPGEDN